ncbi:DNA-binding protein WhiA [Candidatus Contubernalis alkaliaceticus]|uniref:DNA-binding protein WhiA n=1 Tax=Candidatus Contubernalis alkaliaceticus TaxID=338645 RepID=UPI001F4C4C35|nr:DNA-binding protein WhiA [Candidatus Contubernalis alkalaceticus]UNC90789.1 DNA-binding protein WhiA [Candidatus Contubernalis alkalaceticus]
MSFSFRVKNELARINFKGNCCLKAELTAFIHMNGSLQITHSEIALVVHTENPAVARRIFLFFKKIFAVNSHLLVKKKTRLKKNNMYLVKISGKEMVQEILLSLKIITREQDLSGFNKKIAGEIIGKKCCRRAYLRGAFLSRGSISNPDTSYHLEIGAEYEEQAGEINFLLESFDIEGKVIPRKSSYLVYLKDSHKILELLNVIGAHQGMFYFENVRILKEMRNNINRLVNCDTANLNKTVTAAVNQLESIRNISLEIGFENIPNSLRQVAELRIKYPQATLQELGEMFTPPLSKSGVNHRMRKLEKMSKNIKK